MATIVAESESLCVSALGEPLFSLPILSDPSMARSAYRLSVSGTNEFVSRLTPRGVTLELLHNY